ncbi:uncharacterized protein LOC120350573 [Nilaparvata lugens]|uniref:uncharacterized protein LOC120350573 n=1 Tax=Nilaparvata lugens TaxID=108931 RepID=UPI00193C8A30|nr:uncharacterized protein LOC120350573 [Nilaparvata lugens]
MLCSKCCETSIPEQDFLTCNACGSKCHYLCQLIKESNFRKMSSDNKSKWKCIACKTSPNASTNTNTGGSPSVSTGEEEDKGQSLSLSTLDLQAIAQVTGSRAPIDS